MTANVNDMIREEMYRSEIARLNERIAELEKAARAVVELVYDNAYEKIHYCDEMRWGIVHDGMQSLIDLKNILG
jgi:hypothetical protein